MTDELRPVLIMTGGHTTQPLWPHLAEHYDICMAHPQMTNLMTELNIKGAFGLQKYLSADVQEDAVNAAYAMTAKLYQPEVSASIVTCVKDAFGDETVPENLREPQVMQWWPAMVGEHLRQEVLLVNMLDKLTKDRKVSGCIVHEDVTPDARAIVLFCKHRGIPTIHVPHANCYYVGQQWDIHTESICDYIAASGEYMREWYIKWGYAQDRITITGMPQLDHWYSQHKLSKQEARKVLGWQQYNLDPDAFCLIYATTWGQLTSARGGFDAELQDSLRQVMETAKELNAVLCIKMHPGEGQGQEQGYLDALKKNNVTGFVTRQFNEYVLTAGDALVAHGPSNICLSSAAIGLPSVYIPTEDYDFPIPGPVLSRDNVTHAVKIAMLLDKDKVWGEFAHAMNDSHSNGGACERITEFVRQVCPLQ